MRETGQKQHARGKRRELDASFGIVPILMTDSGPHFLLIQHHAGHWAFPKGHPEGEETPIQTACREFEEETGVQGEYRVEPAVSFVEQYHFTRHGRIVRKTVQYFPGWVTNPKVSPQEEEISNIAWLDYAAARRRITHKASRAILDDAMQYVRTQQD